MDKQKVIEALNRALAEELAALTQYMWQHVMGRGIASPAIRDELKAFSIQEMKHAEVLAERIDHFGGVPTTKPLDIKVGGDLKKMIQYDLDLENSAIKMYKEYIELAKEDPVTHKMLIDILADEENHADELESWLE